MKPSLHDRLRNIGVAFTPVGIAALCLSLAVFTPDQGAGAPAIGAAAFMAVGLVTLGIWAVSRR